MTSKSKGRRKGAFRIFTRTWWTHNADWPNGLEPCAGPATTIGYADTEREAQQKCQEWNARHKPGKLSRKAEFTQDIEA